MQRILLGCILLWACGVAACQRQERTLVDLLRFPNEVRTVVIAPEYESWYHDVGENRGDGATADGATADEESLDQKYDEEGDEDRDVEESGEALDDEYNVGDDTFEEDSLETHSPRE
ncbi:MAG: hypothetical protein NTY19_34700 [Planctomycetota bacterium]|nr:hypothetical protein [Planctomycetota bacterium]